MTREELIAEAEKVAAKHDNQCSPCVWWVCDWTGAEDTRRMIALYDVLQETRRAPEAQKCVCGNLLSHPEFGGHRMNCPQYPGKQEKKDG